MKALNAILEAIADVEVPRRERSEEDIGKRGGFDGFWAASPLSSCRRLDKPRVYPLTQSWQNAHWRIGGLSSVVRVQNPLQIGSR